MTVDQKELVLNDFQLVPAEVYGSCYGCAFQLKKSHLTGRCVFYRPNCSYNQVYVPKGKNDAKS